MSNIIPFGKYKGQPIEVLADDREYVDRQQHSGIYQIIIDNFCEPAETPEHNEMQLAFLKPERIRKFIAAACENISYYTIMKGLMFQEAVEWATLALQQHPGYSLAFEAGDARPLLVWSPMRFEVDAVDVSFEIRAGFGTRLERSSSYLERSSSYRPVYRDDSLNREFRIEIKPSLGDDFPAVLRQMRRNKSNVLLVRSFESSVPGSVTEDQVRKFFGSQKIQIIFEREIFSADEFSIDMFDLALITTAMAEARLP